MNFRKLFSIKELVQIAVITVILTAILTYMLMQ